MPRTVPGRNDRIRSEKVPVVAAVRVVEPMAAIFLACECARNFSPDPAEALRIHGWEELPAHLDTPIPD